jgi:trk system potassium uptake protein TrkA
MKIIVMGCGRIGEHVSRLMANEGHEVIVIDKNPQALARLRPNFKGRTVEGIGFDKDVLIEAGIEDADAFAATSTSDNANIISARIARNVFHVPKVVARLYDPRRIEIYQRLGLQTISSTSLGAEHIRELLIYAELEPVMTFGGGEVRIITMETPYRIVGQIVKHLTISGEITVVAITRKGVAFIPHMGTEFRTGDLIHLAILANSMERFNDMIGLGEGV